MIDPYMQMLSQGSAKSPGLVENIYHLIIPLEPNNSFNVYQAIIPLEPHNSLRFACLPKRIYKEQLLWPPGRFTIILVLRHCSLSRLRSLIHIEVPLDAYHKK